MSRGRITGLPRVPDTHEVSGFTSAAVWQEGGTKLWGRIRRLFCKNFHRLYNELSIILCPYKHYEVEVIEGVVDEVISPDDWRARIIPVQEP